MVTTRIRIGITFVLMSLLMCLLGACSSNKAPVTTTAYRLQPTECLGTTGGEVILKVYAKGFDKKAAIEAAKRKAVEEITFIGIHAGDASVAAYPIINDPSARTRHATFFEKFFSGKGKYNQYVRAEKAKYVEGYQGEDLIMCVVNVFVDRKGLRDYYIKEEIIPNTK